MVYDCDPDASPACSPHAEPPGTIPSPFELHKLVVPVSAEPPIELKGVATAESVRASFTRGEVPDTHRFLRMLQKLSLGLSVEKSADMTLAEARLFAVPPWMERISSETGLDLWVERAYCALVVIFHRWGLCSAAFKVEEEMRNRGFGIPTCTWALLIELCINAKDFERVPMLLGEASSAAELWIQGRAKIAVGCGERNRFAVEGLPSWVSSREGHLVALVAAHASVLGSLTMEHNGDVLHAGKVADEFESGCDPGTASFALGAETPEIASQTLSSGLQLLQRSVAMNVAGPSVNIEKRLQAAQRLLLRPCVRFVTKNQSSFTPARLRNILQNFSINRCKDCPEVDRFISGSYELCAENSSSVKLSDCDRADAIHSLLSLLRRLRARGRSISRDDVDELLRSLGKRRNASKCAVLAAFEANKVLALLGSAPLESTLQNIRNSTKHMQEHPTSDDRKFGNDLMSKETGDEREVTLSSERKESGRSCFFEEDGASLVREKKESTASVSGIHVSVETACSEDCQSSTFEVLGEPPNWDLLPDADMFAAAIEGLFLAGNAEAAEHLYAKCCCEYMPNPAVFAAAIFGRLGVDNGDGAASALDDMEKFGFAPHARFLQRFLRHAGNFYEHGLRVIERHANSMPPGARLGLFHALMEACSAGSDPGNHALAVYRNMLARGLEPVPDTHFALLRALSGIESEKVALDENSRLQKEGALPAHPTFEALLRECFDNGERRRRSGSIMDARRRWIRRAFATLTPRSLADLEAACIGAKKNDPSDARCTWLLPAYLQVLPLDCAAVHVAQYMVARYYLLRSGEDRDALQVEINQAFQVACEVHGANWDPFGIAVRVVFELRDLETTDSAQVRILRILCAASQSTGASFSSEHGTYVEKRAEHLLPEVLSELLDLRASMAACDFLYGGANGQVKLANLVARHYLPRGSSEPIKLSTAIRFVRAHGLGPWLDDDPLLEPVLAARQVQLADSLCEGDLTMKCRLVAFAIHRPERRVAGRLAERFDIASEDDSTLHPVLPAGWTVKTFRVECVACISEAEEAEAAELRATHAKRISSDGAVDENCLRLPSAVQEVLLVDSAVLLARVSDLYDSFCRGNEPKVIGLDVEWRPHLEKRGGMQKHRRSGQAGREEPCSTLQVATESFITIFDLLALAPEGASTAEQFSALVCSLFTDASIQKLGFGLRQDVLRLATSYPHLSCFRCINSFLDVQEAWFMAMNAAKGEVGVGAPCGLSALCDRHLGSPLSKRLQTSDWGARPLSNEQLQYAALDAHCLIGLAQALPSTHDASAPNALKSLEVRSGASGQLIVHIISEAINDDLPVEDLATVDAQIVAKGNEVRALKLAGAPKSSVQAEVAVLLQLKAHFRQLAGVDWAPPTASVAKC